MPPIVQRLVGRIRLSGEAVSVDHDPHRPIRSLANAHRGLVAMADFPTLKMEALPVFQQISRAFSLRLKTADVDGAGCIGIQVRPASPEYRHSLVKHQHVAR
jgi:hypothetical protein